MTTVARHTGFNESFDGVRAGYVHDSVVEMDNNGVKFLRASRRLLETLPSLGWHRRGGGWEEADETSALPGEAPFPERGLPVRS